MAEAERTLVAEERSGHCAVVEGNWLYVWGGYVSIAENEVFLPSDEIWIYDMDSGIWIIFFGGYGSKMLSELNDIMNFNVDEASWVGEMFWGWNNEVHVFDTSGDSWIQPPVKGTRPLPRAAHACTAVANKGYVFGGRVVNQLSAAASRAVVWCMRTDVVLIPTTFTITSPTFSYLKSFLRQIEDLSASLGEKLRKTQSRAELVLIPFLASEWGSKPLQDNP
ncbi:KLDC1 protein, partial [Polypterus senegalus]